MTDLKKNYYARFEGQEPLVVEIDIWREDGENIFDDKNLTAVEKHLEYVGCVVVEHWHYRGASAPTRFVVTGFDDFAEYLQERTKPGDAIDVYPIPTKPIARGKCPDLKGRVPEGGAY